LKLIVFFALSSLLFSCGLKKDKKSDLVFFERSPDFFSQFVNKQDTPSGTVDMTRSKILSTRGLYDIDLVLYQDGQFFFSIPDLPNEKEGFGSWEYNEGRLILKTTHNYPVVGSRKVEYRLIATTPDVSGLRVKFRDRTGEQVLEVVER
jgi:hypothetical protein